MRHAAVAAHHIMHNSNRLGNYRQFYFRKLEL